MSALLEDDDDDFDFEPINKAPDRLNQTLVNFGIGKRFKFCNFSPEALKNPIFLNILNGFMHGLSINYKFEL